MKKLPYLLISLTLLSALSTGCGKKASVAQAEQYLPQQTAQVYQEPAPVQQFPPDSPDMSNPVNSNLPETTTTPKSQTTAGNSKIAAAITDTSLSADSNLLPDNVPALQPSPSASSGETPVVEEPKVPWYKKIINKVKSFFS